MRIAITGASGLIGKAATARLTRQGWEVIPMVRRRDAGSTGIYWNPDEGEHGEIDSAALEGIDAVIHLAGESIAAKRWDDAHKKRVLESRTRGAGLVAGAVAKLNRPPQVFIGASAIGYYGNRGDDVLTEESAPGSGFLADVVVAWEKAYAPIIASGIRTPILRIGIVLAKDGGALSQMLTPFKLGVGGVVGSGNQYMSWVSLTDVAEVIRYTLQTSMLRGPINVTGPRPATNREFTKALGKVLKRPTVLPVPAFAIKALFGEMGESLVLEGARVVPEVLRRAGYSFITPDLESALDKELG